MIYMVILQTIIRLFGYERVYLPLYKVADTPFHIQGDDMSPETHDIEPRINKYIQPLISMGQKHIAANTKFWASVGILLTQRQYGETTLSQHFVLLRYAT